MDHVWIRRDPEKSGGWDHVSQCDRCGAVAVPALGGEWRRAGVSPEGHIVSGRGMVPGDCDEELARVVLES